MSTSTDHGFCKHRERSEDDVDNLPITGNLTKDISVFLGADLECGGYCALGAAASLLKRSLKEIRMLRRQLLDSRSRR